MSCLDQLAKRSAPLVLAWSQEDIAAVRTIPLLTAEWGREVDLYINALANDVITLNQKCHIAFLRDVEREIGARRDEIRTMLDEARNAFNGIKHTTASGLRERMTKIEANVGCLDERLQKWERGFSGTASESALGQYTCELTRDNASCYQKFAKVSEFLTQHGSTFIDLTNSINYLRDQITGIKDDIADMKMVKQPSLAENQFPANPSKKVKVRLLTEGELDHLHEGDQTTFVVRLTEVEKQLEYLSAIITAPRTDGHGFKRYNERLVELETFRHEIGLMNPDLDLNNFKDLLNLKFEERLKEIEDKNNAEIAAIRKNAEQLQDGPGMYIARYVVSWFHTLMPFALFALIPGIPLVSAITYAFLKYNLGEGNLVGLFDLTYFWTTVLLTLTALINWGVRYLPADLPNNSSRS